MCSCNDSLLWFTYQGLLFAKGPPVFEDVKSFCLPCAVELYIWEQLSTGIQDNLNITYNYGYHDKRKWMQLQFI